jgi:hypothetical protein
MEREEGDRVDRTVIVEVVGIAKKSFSGVL